MLVLTRVKGESLVFSNGKMVTVFDVRSNQALLTAWRFYTDVIEPEYSQWIKVGESFTPWSGIQIILRETRSNRTSLAIGVPDDVIVWRDEILDRDGFGFVLPPKKGKRR